MQRNRGRLAIAAAAVVLLMVGLLSTPLRAFATTTTHDIMIGLAVSNANVTQNWHTPGRSLDLVNSSGGTAGVSVYSQTVGTFGSTATAVRGTFSSPKGCSGVKVVYQTNGGTKIGETDYDTSILLGRSPGVGRWLGSGGR